MINVTISLVSYNQRHDLERLLPSLIPAAGLVQAEILLVDNRSLDGTREWVHKNYPVVNTLFNPNQAGYGENHNLNLQRARGRYFVIMNSDMTVAQDVFACLKGFMEKHNEAGIVSPKVLNKDGTIQGLNMRYPSVLDLFLRRFWPKVLRRFVQQRLDYYEMRDIGYDRTCAVPLLSGAFMFCRTDLLKSLGGFDPGYFLYFEDADLCRRVQKTHRTMYCPETTVVHFWRRSGHKKWIYTWMQTKSAARYFRKWGLKIW